MRSTVADVILEAATLEFARTGLAGARMARIARQAGVSTAGRRDHDDRTMTRPCAADAADAPSAT